MHSISNQNSNNFNMRISGNKHIGSPRSFGIQSSGYQPWGARRFCCQCQSLFTPGVHRDVGILPGTRWDSLSWGCGKQPIQQQTQAVCAVDPCLLHSQLEWEGWCQRCHPNTGAAPGILVPLPTTHPTEPGPALSYFLRNSSFPKPLSGQVSSCSGYRSWARAKWRKSGNKQF